MKTCTKCRMDKPLSSFSKGNKANKGGLHPWCKECCSIHSKEKNKAKEIPGKPYLQWSKVEQLWKKVIPGLQPEPSFAQMRKIIKDEPYRPAL